MIVVAHSCCDRVLGAALLSCVVLSVYYAECKRFEDENARCVAAYSAYAASAAHPADAGESGAARMKHESAHASACSSTI